MGTQWSVTNKLQTEVHSQQSSNMSKPLSHTMLRVTCLALCALLVSAGCSAKKTDDKNIETMGNKMKGADMMDKKACMTVAETAASDPELSVLVEAVTAAGLAETLSDPSLEATIFAPTDAAFTQALTDLGLTKEELLADTETLTNVLTFHVVPGVAAKSTDLTDGQMLPTLEGSDLTVDLSMPSKVAINPGDVEVIKPDIEACKAVIHVVDKVLVPPAAPAP